MENEKAIKGADFKKMRLKAELTTTEASVIAGVRTRKTYENWERESGTPDINQFVALCEGFNFSPVVILVLAVKRSREKPDGDLDLTIASTYTREYSEKLEIITQEKSKQNIGEL